MNMMETSTKMEELKRKCNQIEEAAGSLIAQFTKDRLNSGNFSQKSFLNDVEHLVKDFPKEMQIRIMSMALSEFVKGSNKKKSRSGDEDDGYLGSMFASRRF